MFSKLKNFSEDVINELNNVSDQNQKSPKSTTNSESLNQLLKSAKVLATETPDVSKLTQPSDEEISNNVSTEEGSEKATLPPINNTTIDTTDNGTATTTTAAAAAPQLDLDQLPAPIKSKLKKFAKYEEKYPILLDAYKLEKKKNEIIKIFEKVLQENTPVSSLSEGKLLVEYLNGLNEKTKLLNGEIRKLTKDNNTMNFKIVKLEESNKELNNDVKRLDTMQKEKEVMGKKIDSMSEELEIINLPMLEP